MSFDKKQIAEKAIIFILLLIVVFLTISCKECTTEPTVYPPTELSMDYRGASFVWLRLSMADSGSVQMYTIQRNSKDLKSGYFRGTDTLIIDDTVLPDSNYVFKAFRIRNGNSVDSSEAVDVLTLDTTSHNFRWEIDTLGDYGSVLNDVFAFSENEVWVVGEIEVDSDNFNAAKWNGSEWSLSKIDLGGSIYGIYGFSSNEIWIASGITHFWDGNEWNRYQLWDMGILDSDDGYLTKVWGSSPTNVYFIGMKGTIVHYDGTNFTRMDSWTDAELRDIDGVVDPVTGQIRIWVTGIGVLLYSEGEDWEVVWNYEHPYFEDNFNNPNTVFVPDDKVFTVSVWGGDNSGVYLFNQLYPQENYLLFNHDLYVRGMGGNDVNDFFIVGNFNKVYHYNGNTEKCYSETEIGGRSFGICQVDNSVFIVGYTGSSYRAVVFRGVR